MTMNFQMTFPNVNTVDKQQDALVHYAVLVHSSQYDFCFPLLYWNMTLNFTMTFPKVKYRSETRRAQV